MLLSLKKVLDPIENLPLTQLVPRHPQMAGAAGQSGAASPPAVRRCRVDVTADDVLAALQYSKESYGDHFKNVPRSEALFLRTTPPGGPSPVTTYIAFPGTASMADGVIDLKFGMRTLADLDQRSRAGALHTLPGSVHVGFLTRLQHVLATTAVAEAVKKAVKAKERVVFTGHSLGGAVATLACVWALCRCAGRVDPPCSAGVCACTHLRLSP